LNRKSWRTLLSNPTLDKARLNLSFSPLHMSMPWFLTTKLRLSMGFLPTYLYNTSSISSPGVPSTPVQRQDGDGLTRSLAEWVRLCEIAITRLYANRRVAIILYECPWVRFGDSPPWVVLSHSHKYTHTINVQCHPS